MIQPTLLQYGKYFVLDAVFDMDITFIGFKSLVTASNLYFVGRQDSKERVKLNEVDGYFEPTIIKKGDVLRVVSIYSSNSYVMYYTQ